MGQGSLHSFHIPVMGLAYTIDSPIRVAHFGISSVISIMDDDLIEKMNAYYSRKFGFAYDEITSKVADFRAKRITSYLNLVDKIVREKVESFKSELTSDRQVLDAFLSMLPTRSDFRSQVEKLLADGKNFKDTISNYIDRHLHPGNIDVNIMTKVDRENRDENGVLPIIFNDAHAALRGFANSVLSSSVVLSAGMHPRLYSYFECFPEFFPDKNSELKKKITIKVSDYRSAQIQGCFLAKKGLWVSEFRIESGLNCGGHAFATDGHLLGPILEEFREKKDELTVMMHELLIKSLAQKNLPVPSKPMKLKITVQGGVGTFEEHAFLLNHYNVDSVGWGSPFLLVPEATSADEATRNLLASAREDDLYTSNMSPLGVPFNTVRGMTHDALRQKRIDDDKPGSSCPKKFLALNKEYGDEGICTASRKYQKKKLRQIEADTTIDSEMRIRIEAEVLEKSCLCVGLSNSALLENDIRIKGDQSVVICPGPNIAYFKRQYSLSEMIDHIYGRKSVLVGTSRPNFFIKELAMYANHLEKEFEKAGGQQSIGLMKLRKNLLEGVTYYRKLFNGIGIFNNKNDSSITDLDSIAGHIESVASDAVLEQV